MSIESTLRLEQFADQLVTGIDWGSEPDRSVFTITTTGTTSIPDQRIWDMGSSDGVYVMPEQRYTYRRVRDMYGRESYERVPYDPSAPTLEDPVTVPRLAPAVRNGERPGMGSVVVEELLRRTAEAEARRVEAERAPGPVEPAKQAAPAISEPRRVIEP
jgi:hypothetical protein